MFRHLIPAVIIAIIFIGTSCAERDDDTIVSGEFIQLTGANDEGFRAYIAGPEDASAGVMIIHDWFGISEFTKGSVERLGNLGYRTIAIDLYNGTSATTHPEAEKLMGALNREVTDARLQSGLDFLKRQDRKIATIGFSMGGLESSNANLNDPEAVGATVIIYGGDFDKIVVDRLKKLSSPVLTITGSKDGWSLPSSTNFLTNMEEAGRLAELYVYPGARHAYAQPLFNGGQNYDKEATRLTWLLTEDFLKRHL